jgi:hypothetical protein
LTTSDAETFLEDSSTSTKLPPDHPNSVSGTHTVPAEPTRLSHQASSRTLLLAPMKERELFEVDGLSAGSAATGPAAQDGL